jgi:hypothetical protein
MLGAGSGGAFGPGIVLTEALRMPEARGERVTALDVVDDTRLYGVEADSVKRRSKGTPDRRRRGTPFSDNMMLVC